MPPTPLSPESVARHEAWLREITSIPTAAGKEQRVIAWIERWAATRPEIDLTRDACGNLHIAFRNAPTGERPVYFTAHLDHPAFVVERIIAPGLLELSFRGGVMDDYFNNARVRVYDGFDRAFGGTILPDKPDGQAGTGGPFKHYLAQLDADGSSIGVGDVGVWDLPGPETIDGCLHTSACDDLAALAGAISAYDELARRWGDSPLHDVRLLFTRAEEIGFIGAIGACRHATVARDARVIALENSRAFPESPIGAGPIVRVGDRISVFSATLTGAIARRAEEIAGGASTVTASQKLADAPAWKWQRKLMAGGACEASVFCHAGLEATCVCLPLGNYHNMGDLGAVQAGTNTTPPTVAREFISLSDYRGLIDLLIACAERLPENPGMTELVERLWKERAFVLA